MQAEFIPLTEREHCADHEHPAGAVVEMRPGPDLAPGVARDQVDELSVERVLVGDRFVDPGIAQHLAALRHAVIAALLIVHGGFLLSLRAQRSNPVRRAKKEWIASSLRSSQ